MQKRLNTLYCFLIRFIALTLLLLPLGVNAQVFETATLRFGNGVENSVNTSGNLQQPFYWDTGASQFYRLTFSNYPLDIAVAWGGDGTNEWNINGTLVETQNGSYVYGGQVIDTSGYISTGADSGYGTIISTGTVNIGGADLQIRQTYTLTQTDAFITINTEVTNTSGAPVTNVRVWVGTRDDYVGTDDGPVKQRGNLVAGAFEQIANAADRSTALLITADSGAATPGVLFYTTAPNANASVNTCCSFSNAYQQDPATSAIQTPGQDGSYAMFVRMPDLAIGESSDFTWYYAAGDVSVINDIIADVAAASSSVSNISYTSADLAATLTADSTGYWIVVPAGSAVPTEAQIEAGVDYGAVTVAASGSGPMTADVEAVFNMTGLTPATDYDVHFVGEDITPAYSAISSASFTTLAYTAPVVSITDAATSITGSTAVSGGTVDTDGSDGAQPVTARGVCWSTLMNPTTADTCTSNGTGLGAFVSNISGLVPSTLYYVRAFATNGVGTGYGPQISFTTAADDGDGVALAVEDAGPNGGDGNNDGTADSLQSNVSSLPDATGSGYLTLEVGGGCATAQAVAAVDIGSMPASDPFGYLYPYGLLEFTLPCETADITVYYHIPGATSLVSSVYRKYGPVPPGGPSATWYTLPGVVYGTANVGGTMVATASFTLADNVLGDDTGDDGVIVDQGGPGFPGAARPIPTLSNLVVLLLALLVGVVAVRSIRRVTH
ncbi:MAG: hypothetical protein JAY84_15935 [Candidatus Thiodiazotropha taylori]|nr:hypothetical protein [Candidatus Thiodiazotropha taylori]